MTKHEIGKCDICHEDYTGQWPYHGIFGGVGQMTRYCNECWDKMEEATRITAENLGCTPEQLNNAINHFKKIEEAEANEPKEKIDEIIRGLKNLESIHDLVVVDLIEKLEKFRDEEL